MSLMRVASIGVSNSREDRNASKDTYLDKWIRHLRHRCPRNRPLHRKSTSREYSGRWRTQIDAKRKLHLNIQIQLSSASRDQFRS